jgi:hypothetical protein
MGTCFSFTFAGDRVGLIVRGKTSTDDDPGVMAQHADCITSNGAPMGFFGEGNDGSFNSSGVGMSGAVYDFTALGQHRPYYTDIAMAKGYGVVSTALIISVPPLQGAAFDDAWAELKASPPGFTILGLNCSTRASQAFQKAKVLSAGIPGLDTPNNLYKQIVKELGGRCSSYSGYVGFSPAGNGYLVQLETI